MQATGTEKLPIVVPLSYQQIANSDKLCTGQIEA